MKMRSWLLPCLLAAGMVGAVAAGQATAPVPDIAFQYRIVRDGKPVGRHMVQLFDGKGERDVHVAFSIDTRIALFKVRVKHDAWERWDGAGALKELRASTDGPTKLSEVLVEPAGPRVYTLLANGEQQRIQGGFIPTSFSNIEGVFEGQRRDINLLDTMNGKLRPSYAVRKNLSDPSCDCDGSGASAYYEIYAKDNGKLTHRVWLDRDGLVLKLGLQTRFGYYFEYQRESVSRKSPA
jgi:hypothetical protein